VVTVVMNAKFHSSQEMAGLFIVMIVSKIINKIYDSKKVQSF